MKGRGGANRTATRAARVRSAYPLRRRPWRISTAETNRNPTGAVWARRRTESWMRSERAAGGSVSGMRAHSGGMQLAGPGIGMGIGHGPTWHGIGYCLVSLSVGERSGIPQRRSAAHPASTSVRTGRIPKSERDCCIVPHSGHLTAHAQKSRLTSLDFRTLRTRSIWRSRKQHPPACKCALQALLRPVRRDGHHERLGVVHLRTAAQQRPRTVTRVPSRACRRASPRCHSCRHLRRRLRTVGAATAASTAATLHVKRPVRRVAPGPVAPIARALWSGLGTHRRPAGAMARARGLRADSLDCVAAGGGWAASWAAVRLSRFAR